MRGNDHLPTEVEPIDAAACVDFKYLDIGAVGQELIHQKILVRGNCELLPIRQIHNESNTASEQDALH